MNQKVIIVTSKNVTPEKGLKARLGKLGAGWRVISATTNLATHGSMDTDGPNMGVWYGVAQHVYYVTTAIVEKIS